jgi:hypothetical protein
MSLAEAKEALAKRTRAKNITCSIDPPPVCEDSSASALLDETFGGSPRLVLDDNSRVERVFVTYALMERQSLGEAVAAFVPEWGDPTAMGENRAVWTRKTHYAEVSWQPGNGPDPPRLTITLVQGSERHAP